MRVPADLLERVGLREVRRSLNVHHPSEARRLAPKYAARVMEAFKMIRAADFTGEHARELVKRCFHDLAQEVDGGFVAGTSDPDYELAVQIEAWTEHAANLGEQIAVGNYRPGIVQRAAAELQRDGIAWEELPAAKQQQVLEGVARAMIEQQRLYEFRLKDRLLPYSAVDPLLAVATAVPVGEVPTTAPTVVVGPTLEEVADRYLTSGRTRWSPKTWKSRSVRIGFVVEHIRPETPIASITPAHLRGYADAVCRLRNTRTAGGGSFLARQTENLEHRIGAKTAALIFDDAKAMFRWAKSKQGFTSTNPAEDVSLDLPKAPKGLKPRRPFTPEELEKLFSAPLFTGHRSAKLRFNPGSELAKDDRYWLPILGFYTGARLGELVQLHLADLHLDGAIPFISITEAGGGAIGTDEHKSVKSQAGVRRVPLHPELMALGFADFVTRQRKDKRKPTRLFWRTAYGADSQASTVFSKWFGRLLDKVGLTDPALVYHSLRHNAEDSFRNALLPQQVIDGIIGHADTATSAGYGEGVWLETAYDAVKAMKLRIDLPAVLAKTSNDPKNP